MAEYTQEELMEKILEYLKNGKAKIKSSLQLWALTKKMLTLL